MTTTAQRYTTVATTAEVDARISTIASDVLRNHPNESPVFVALLRGAAPFASKLMTEIVKQNPEYHPELDYMMVSTYGRERKAGAPQIVTDLAPTTAVDGRTVVIIDDVLDKGITADFVTNHLLTRGAGRIELAVLCDKNTVRERDVLADYIGFTFEDAWLVGMGMDDAEVANEGYRWLYEIREVNR